MSSSLELLVKHRGVKINIEADLLPSLLDGVSCFMPILLLAEKNDDVHCASVLGCTSQVRW
jgi:hypothetical protein